MKKFIEPKLLLPLVGLLLLFAVWEFVISVNSVKAILLPPPGETLAYLWNSIWSGAIYIDLTATIQRTLYAFLIAAAAGIPLGIALGSSVALYRSVEFLVDFFRSTPSSALIPLFMLIFGITDLNKIMIAAFAAILVIIFNSAYGVMNAKKPGLWPQ